MRSRQRSRSTNKSLGVSRQRRIARVATIVVVTVVAIMGVWELGRYYHKWGAPNELRAIKAEKITKMDVSGLTLVSSEVNGMGSFVSKIVSPSVERVFDIGSASRETAVQRIIDLAEEDGWVYDPTLEVGDEWWGREQSRGFDLAITIRSDASNQRSILVRSVRTNLLNNSFIM